MEEQTEGQRDRPYFIGPFLPRPGSKKTIYIFRILEKYLEGVFFSKLQAFWLQLDYKVNSLKGIFQ